MNSHSWLSLLVIVWLSIISWSVTVEDISMEVFSANLLIIRKPTALMVEAVISRSLFLSTVLKGMFARVTAV